MGKAKKSNIGNFALKYSSLTILMVYNLVTIIVSVIFYPLIPILMGYPPGFKDVGKKLGVTYQVQFFSILFFAVLIGTVIFLFLFKGINKWRILNIDNDTDLEKLNKIRKKCINMPYLIYIGQMTIINVPLLIILLIVAIVINKGPIIIPLKIFTIVFSIFALAGVFSHIISKRIFSRILFRTFNGQKPEGFRIKLSRKIFLQIIPMFIVAILFTAMLGYSRLVEEKGNIVYLLLKNQIVEKFKDIGDVKDDGQILDKLKEISSNNLYGFEVSYFVIEPDKKIKTSNGYIPTAFFNYFINHPVNGDRVYGDSNETQGVLYKIKGSNGDYVAGIKFELGSNKTVNYFLVAFLALMIMNIFVLYYFSRSISGDISVVADSLNDIAEGESVDLNKKIPVTSNDEISDLVVAFNKILDKEKEHIEDVEEQQAILMEQDRLASLGNLIGGIAHNLRTPIMSLSGGIEGLKDLIKEYDESLEDEKVTKADHHEIAKEMTVWVEKMRPYCSYMSDIITAVKGQTVQPGDKSEVSFTIDEVRKRIDILLEHELRKRHCKLNMDIKAEKELEINGEISILIQVLNNLIINAVDAYDGKGGDIDLVIQSSEKVVQFIIRDYGQGIPRDIQEKLFKEMITTKGTKGTGLGLYMSYSNVKARFAGKMRFESEVGKGTTFYIYIPFK